MQDNQSTPQDLTPTQQPGVSPQQPPEPAQPVQPPRTDAPPAQAPTPPQVPEGFVPRADFEKMQSIKDREAARARAELQLAAQRWQQERAALQQQAQEAVTLKQQQAEQSVRDKGGTDADVQLLRLQYDNDHLKDQLGQAQQWAQGQAAQRQHELGVATSIQYAKERFVFSILSAYGINLFIGEF